MHACRKIVLGVVLGMSMSLVGCDKGTSERDISGGVLLTLADVRQAIERRDGEEPEHALLIDPRAPKYYAAGHMPGAVNLRLPDVREEDELDSNLRRYSRLIVYGDNPGTPVARAMFKRLLAAGYSGVRFYAAGLDEWVRSGGRLETSELPRSEDEE